ncbi:MAG: pyruvate ferredoxin oxidoreductase [Candidatus Moranbacteria bacterium]|nr:pyruvate ferredoxin oxidoreductase [bacterium]MDP1833508.1 pyruvate ferredoxin oxidoreductase [Candidatus Moranbacteria bacterium]
MKNGKNKNRIALTGGAAAAEALKQIEPDVMAVYPITPQTTIIETFAKFKADGEVETEVIEVESEHSAISACVGSSAAGARTVTATSSQGLALMNEILYIASGMRLPILMVVSARALSAPINIHGDHSDVMGARDAGWIQIFSENTQEIYDNTIIGMKLAEKTKLPVMAIMDGFNTSHCVENLEILSKDQVQKFLGEFSPEKYLLDIEHPVTFGPLALQNSYFEFKVQQEEAMEKAGREYLKIAKEFEKISGRKKDYFEAYKTEDAEEVIILAGSTAGTTKDVVDRMRQTGKKVGLLKISLFRPFPLREILSALKNAKSIAVMERAISSGTYPPIYNDIVNGLYQSGETKKVQSIIYSLGGRDIFAKDIEKVFEDLKAEKISKEIKYIGV